MSKTGFEVYSESVGYAVATRESGMLVSEVLPRLRDAERLVKLYGCASYEAVEVRALPH